MNKNYQKKLTEALRNKLQSTQFSKITVADICRETGVSRQCFYYYFQDLNDCLLSMFLDEFNLIPKSERTVNNPPTLRSLLEMLYNYIYNNKTLIMNLSEGPHKIYLFEKIFNTAAANLKRFLPVWIPESTLLPRADIDYIISYYIASFVASISLWIKGDFATTPDFEAVHFMLLSDGMVKEWVNRFIAFNKKKGLPERHETFMPNKVIGVSNDGR